MSEDPNGWEPPRSTDHTGVRSLREAAGGPAPWRRSRKRGKLPPVTVPYRGPRISTLDALAAWRPPKEQSDGED